MNKQYLCEIVELFVVKEKRHRFLEFIDSPKRYDDLLHELLNDPRHLRPECIIEVPGREADTVGKLRKLGAGRDAYLVSDDWDLNGKTDTLAETL